MHTTSATIAAMYLMAPGTSLCELANRNLESRVHLVREKRSECGAIVGFTEKSVVTLPRAVDTNAWCYSCMGNALKFLEKGAA